MAKRFTETKKWEDVWFRKLPNDYKLFWLYLCDRCDNAGIWEKDLELANFILNTKITEEEALKLFNQDKTRIQSENNNKWQICNFIDFQFGELSAKSTLHRHIINLIEQHKNKGYLKGIKRVSKGYLNPLSNGIGKGNSNGKGISKGNKEGGMGETKEIIDDLNLVLGTSYKPGSAKTQELIQARLNEGFTLDDFKAVHRNMFKRWGPDNKMREFLRPITLYSSKFESYLNVKQELPISTEGAKAIVAGQSWLNKKEVIDAK